MLWLGSSAVLGCLSELRWWGPLRCGPLTFLYGYVMGMKVSGREPRCCKPCKAGWLKEFQSLWRGQMWQVQGQTTVYLGLSVFSLHIRHSFPLWANVPVTIRQIPSLPLCFSLLSPSFSLPFFLLFLFFFEMVSHFLALAALELPMWTKLPKNSQRFTCLCTLSAGIKAMHPYTHSPVKLFEVC